MEINITLIFQAVQFLLVYFFLYRCLFRPACAILHEQVQEKDELYNHLKNYQQIKDALAKDYQIKHDAFQAQLIQEIPEQATMSVHQHPMVDATLVRFSHHVVSTQEQHELEIFLVDYLAKVIKHD